MNISTLLSNHFTKNQSINIKSLKKAAKESVKLTSHDFSKDVNDILMPFVSTSLKMQKLDSDTYQRNYVFKPLSNVKKDLFQIFNRGMFGEQSNNKFNELCRIFEESSARQGKIYSVFNKSFEIDADVADAFKKYSNLVNKLGEASVKDGKLSLSFDGMQDIEFNSDEQVKFMLLSLMARASKAYNAGVLSEEALPREEKIFLPEIKDVSVYLSTILTFCDICHTDVEKCIKSLAPYMYFAIDENCLNISNAKVVRAAQMLSESRIEELNGKIVGGDKYASTASTIFHDVALERAISESVLLVNDIHACFSQDKGSNYPFSYISNSGYNAYFTTLQPSKDLSEALTDLKSDQVQSVLKAFYFFDKEIMKSKPDQKIDSFEELAELLFANLILTENLEIKDCVKQKLEEIFVVPLLKCANSVMVRDNVNILKPSLKRALDDVRNLPSLGLKFEDYEKSKINIKKELDNFRKLLISAIVTYEKKQGFVKKPALKKNNVVRMAFDAALATLSNKKLPANKFEQKVEKPKAKSDAFLLPNEVYENDKVFPLVESIYNKIISRADMLRDQVEPEKKYSLSEKQSLLETAKLTNEEAVKLVENCAEELTK